MLELTTSWFLLFNWELTRPDIKNTIPVIPLLPSFDRLIEVRWFDN